MKQQVPPAAIVAVIVVVVGIVAFMLFKGTGVQQGQEPPKQPDSVAKEWEKWTGGKKSGEIVKPGGN
jgi:hypothetical protein